MLESTYILTLLIIESIFTKFPSNKVDAFSLGNTLHQTNLLSIINSFSTCVTVASQELIMKKLDLINSFR